MVSKSIFLKSVQSLSKFKSKKGAVYSDLSFSGNTIRFKRESTGKYWFLDLDNVYTAYSSEEYLNTVIIRKYVRHKVYSPSLGLLITTGLLDSAGYRKTINTTHATHRF